MSIHRFTTKIGLVKMSPLVPDDDVVAVAAAIQRHIVENFSGIWEVTASVSPVLKPESLLPGYTPIFIRDDVPDPRIGGFHRTARGMPYGVVQYYPSGHAMDNSIEWSLDASHEALELLVDGFGDSFVAGDSLISSQGRVNYLVEVCDPNGRLDAAHPIDGWPMADFYTPRYFDSTITPGVKYSFSGKISIPKQILNDGYLAWSVPDGSIQGRWYLASRFGGTLEIHEVPPPRLGVTMREGIDLITASRRAKAKVAASANTKLKRFSTQRKRILTAARHHCQHFHNHLRELLVEKLEPIETLPVSIRRVFREPKGKKLRKH